MRAKATGTIRHAPIFEGARILDVGCGGGRFLRLVNAYGAYGKGVEPGEPGWRAARAQGLDVFHGTIHEYRHEYPNDRFDIITANHVIEHIDDPVAALSSMRRMLNGDGLIVVAVPNASCWFSRTLRGRWHSADIPRHLMHFSRRSLLACAERAGLKPRDIYTHSLPRGVAGSVRLLLRYYACVPRTISRRVSFIDKRIAPRLGSLLDQRTGGECLLARLVPYGCSR